jgi:hypothetical protein
MRSFIPVVVSLLSGCIDTSAEPTTATATADSLIPVGGWVYDKGVVNYFVTPKFAASADGMAALASTIDEYQKTTSITFVQQFDPNAKGVVYDLNTEADCGGGSTGARDGANPNLGPLVYICSTNRATVAHETGHALGMWHEQERPDRDLFIRCYGTSINTDIECGASDLACINDPCNKGGDFAKGPDGNFVYAPYDVNSIMQYASWNFARDGGPDTLTLTDNGTCTGELGSCIPDHTDLSIEDINALRQLYQAKLGSDQAGMAYGTAIAVGDFDGDGYMDVAVGAPNSIQDGKTVGAVFLYKGTFGSHQVNGNTTTAGNYSYLLVPWRKIVPATLGVTGQDGEQFGAALAAGDIDGDGVADLTIGAPGRTSGTGAIYQMYGRKFVQPYDWSNNNLPYVFGLQTTSTTEPLAAAYYPATSFGAASAGDHFGAAIAIADFDNDGLSELAIGAPFHAPGGQVAILTHPAMGAMALRQWIKPNVGFSNGQFGFSLATGDFDGDKAADLIVGAPKAEAPGAGAIYLFSSKLGFAQQQGRMMGGPVAGDDYGWALSVGDFHGDGTNQLAVGAPGRSGSGRVEMLGFVGSGTTGFFAPSQTLDQTLASNTNDAGDRFGQALLAARLHGPKLSAELAVGAPGKKGRAADSGVAYVFAGTKAAITTGVKYLAQAKGTHFGWSFGAGDTNHDGSIDLVIGAPDEIGTTAVNATGTITSEEGSRTGLAGPFEVLWPTMEYGPPVLID